MEASSARALEATVIGVVGDAGGGGKLRGDGDLISTEYVTFERQVTKIL